MAADFRMGTYDSKTGIDQGNRRQRTGKSVRNHQTGGVATIEKPDHYRALCPVANLYHLPNCGVDLCNPLQVRDWPDRQLDSRFHFQRRGDSRLYHLRTVSDPGNVRGAFDPDDRWCVCQIPLAIGDRVVSEESARRQYDLPGGQQRL